MDREDFLEEVSRALRETRESTALPAAVPAPPVADLLSRFTEELTKIGGEVITASNLAGAAEQLMSLTAPATGPWFAVNCLLAQGLAQHLAVEFVAAAELHNCQASLAEAEWLIADTGTVGLLLDEQQPRSSYLLPEISVVVSPADRLVPSLADALCDLEQRGLPPTGVVFVTGPSRTADIEKTVVIPAHGPKRLIAVVLA